MIDSLVGRIFRWPRPNTSVDRLLRAILLKDDNEARDAWRAFETSADFDHLEEAEMRLLGLVSKRLATVATNSPMGARISGIERMNWSRSQIAIGEAGRGLRALSAASIEMLAIKGGGCIAVGGMSGLGRLVNVIDIVVRSEEMNRAFDILIEDEWAPAGSGTALFHRAHLANATGVNLVRGQFGNLDLRRTPFRQPYVSIADDLAIWERSAESRLASVSVRVPSPTDAITIALADGLLESHKSSDWIVDIATGIDTGEINWDLLEFIVDRRGLHVPTAATLRYVEQRLRRPVPDPLLGRLESQALRQPLALFARLADKRPVSRVFGLTRTARALTKQHRRWWGKRRHVSEGHPSSVRPSVSFRWTRDNGNANALEYSLTLPDRPTGQAWNGVIDVTLSIKRPAVSRRVEFEVNSNRRHIVRLRALLLGRGTRERLLRFRFFVSLERDDTDLQLVSAPARSFNTNVSKSLVERYRALPFTVADLRIMKR